MTNATRCHPRCRIDIGEPLGPSASVRHLSFLQQNPPEAGIVDDLGAHSADDRRSGTCSCNRCDRERPNEGRRTTTHPQMTRGSPAASRAERYWSR